MLRYSKGNAVWTIAQAGPTITISLDGVETVEQLPSEAVAHKRFDILIGRQAREGWKRIVDRVPKVVARLRPAVVVEDARNPELEAAILADPVNPAGYRIYADWLEQQGDPRGELIALMLAVEATPHDDKLGLMTNAYCNRIHPYLTRGVAPSCKVTIERGFIGRIAAVEGELAAPLRQTLATPSAALVNAIQLDDDGTGQLHAALAVVATAPRSLRTLVIGGRAVLDDIAPVLPILPQLQHLRVFNILHRELVLSERAWRQLLTAPFPRLQSLHLDLSAATEALAPLFARADLPSLTTLSFRSNDDPAILRALATSPLAAQLTSLTLQRFTAQHVETLDAVRSHFPKLARFAVPASWEWRTADVHRTDGLRIEHADPERDRGLPVPDIDEPADPDDTYDSVRE